MSPRPLADARPADVHPGDALPVEANAARHRPAFGRRPGLLDGALRGVSVRPDWLALVVLLVGLVPALVPLAAPGLPDTNDTPFHVQRIMALQGLARDGVPFSRWLPDLAYGYGMPVFGYYAPLAYGPALLAGLAGHGAIVGYKLAAGLALVASSLAMFALARSLFGPLAALAAGLVYAYVPYQLFDLYVRGALAESAAFTWPPLIALCLVRLRADGGRRPLLVLALAVAGLVLTHNITALFAIPVLVALALLLAIDPTGGRRRFLGRAAAGFGLGIGLGAAYWLPAFLERGLVQLEEALVARDTFTGYFLDTWPPLQTSLAYDYVLDPQPGIVQVTLSVVALAAIPRTRGPGRRIVLWAAGLTLGAWLLQTVVAIPLFEALPLARFVQFPFRFLSLMALGSALLVAGAVAALAARPAVALPVALGVVCISAWTALAALDPGRVLAEERYLTAEGLLRAEQANQGTGTTVFGEFLPASVPSATRLRRELLGIDTTRAQGEARPPADLRVEVRAWGPLAVRLRVSAPQADRLRIHQFAFAGWEARLDGRAMPLAADGRYRILAVDVPAGEHDVELRFGWTGPRLAGLALTALALLGLTVAVASPLALSRGRALGGVAGMLGLGSLLLLGGLLGLGRPGAVTADEWPGERLVHQQPVGRDVMLVGSTVEAAGAGRPGVLTAGLEWLALVDRPEPFEVILRADGAGGATHEARWAHGPLVRAWERGELVRTRTDVRLPAGFPDGPVALSLRAEPASGIGGGALGPIELSAPAVRGMGTPAEPPAAPVAPDVAERLDLVGYELATPGGRGHTRAQPGEKVVATVEWLAHGPSAGEVSAALALRGPRGRAAAEPKILGDWFNPPPFWQAGDRFKQEYQLTIPADLPDGDYALALRVTTRERSWMPRPAARRARDRGADEVELGTLAIRRS